MKPLTNRVLPDPPFGAGVGGMSYSSWRQVGVMESAQDASASAPEFPVDAKPVWEPDWDLTARVGPWKLATAELYE